MTGTCPACGSESIVQTDDAADCPDCGRTFDGTATKPLDAPGAGDIHTLRNAAQALVDADRVVAVDITDAPGGDARLEVVLTGGTVPSDVLDALAAFDCALDAGATAPRGDPTQTVVVAL